MKPTERRKSPSPEDTPKICPECTGRGWVDNRCLTPDHAHICAYCNGRGQNLTGQPCYACDGTGQIEVRRVDKNPCPLCCGAGVYPVPEFMSMKDFAYKPGAKADSA